MRYILSFFLVFFFTACFSEEAQEHKTNEHHQDNCEWSKNKVFNYTLITEYIELQKKWKELPYEGWKCKRSDPKPLNMYGKQFMEVTKIFDDRFKEIEHLCRPNECINQDRPLEELYKVRKDMVIKNRKWIIDQYGKLIKNYEKDEPLVSELITLKRDQLLRHFSKCPLDNIDDFKRFWGKNSGGVAFLNYPVNSSDR